VFVQRRKQVPEPDHNAWQRENLDIGAMPNWAGIEGNEAATRGSGGCGIRVERKAFVSWLQLIGSGRSRRNLYSCRECRVGCEQAGEFPFPLIDYRPSDRRGATLSRP